MAETPAVNTPQPAAVETPVTPTVDTTEDYEAKIAKLEEEKANYKLAFLKEKDKNKENLANETEEERVRRITREELAEARLSKFDEEKEALLAKALKENKELKLAHLNKNNVPPASIGAHSEAPTVQDTLVTKEQLDAFKKRGWTDKDIERYKKNLQRYGTR